MKIPVFIVPAAVLATATAVSGFQTHSAAQETTAERAVAQDSEIFAFRVGSAAPASWRRCRPTCRRWNGTVCTTVRRICIKHSSTSAREPLTRETTNDHRESQSAAEGSAYNTNRPQAKCRTRSCRSATFLFRQENRDVNPASAHLIATRLLSLLHRGRHACGQGRLA